MKNKTLTYKENTADTLRFNIAFYIISCFILYIIGQILDTIFAPLKMLSKEEVEKELAKMVEEKIDARENRKINDPNDPMIQFHNRFVEKKPEYAKDNENNKLYYQWFMAWQDGKVIDSDLRWAPTIMKFGEETLRDNFIQYMKIQYALHKKASLAKRILFLNTIRKYYPELSASMNGLENDLANYEEENKIIETERKLREEIQKFGLPKDAADYLVKKNIDAKTLQKEAQIFKSNIEKGYSVESIICLIDNDLDVNDIHLNFLNTKDDNYYELLQVAYLKGYVNNKEFDEICEYMVDMVEIWEEEIFEIAPASDDTLFNNYLKEEIEKCKMNKLTNKLNKRAA